MAIFDILGAILELLSAVPAGRISVDDRYKQRAEVEKLRREEAESKKARAKGAAAQKGDGQAAQGDRSTQPE